MQLKKKITAISLNIKSKSHMINVLAIYNTFTTVLMIHRINMKTM